MQEKPKILIFIPAYNAEENIVKVLKRIPEIFYRQEKYQAGILVQDDASSDKTAAAAMAYAADNPIVKIVKLPSNLGYGGNQKLGYKYAIENDFDIVVLLHGDGQYAPEILEQMIAPIIKDNASAVFGSRMIHPIDALKGGMPLYKFIGNIILTKIQNYLLKTNLSEFHSGYRAYKVSELQRIPFERNADYFDFDTDVIIQGVDNGFKIVEIAIPTYYGDEISYVNGIKYAFKIVVATVLSRLQKRGLCKLEKFSYDD